MPRHVVQRVADALNTRSRAINGARIHLLGVAYKPGVGDTRESPALDVAHLLIVRGAAVTWSDPFVARAETRGGALPHLPLDEALAAGIDCAVITTHHRGVDYADVVERAPLVVDTRNALAGVDAAHVFRL